ncbi:hypothetical protein QBC43DRAFT_289636 [Cladorrhinum sp. PSN259]|nr:hypothetical protein QBC43DRAFT_289636 [Cladorrhinum sp. PSN259]
MANVLGATSGSLAEHDILISISEESINRQFQLLYNKPIRTDKSLPPPPGVTLSGGITTPPSKYLINHDMRILGIYTKKDKSRGFDAQTGVFGHIKCPIISFKGVTEPNTARITFQFEKAGNDDSLFKEWVGVGPEAEVVSTTINGWTMSWIVKLSEKRFGDLNKELLDPVKDNTKPNIAHPETQKALEAVDSSHFTVSAIFCIFEDALLTNTFEVRDENGKYRENTTSFMKSVNAYFTDLQRAVVPGTQTADHPYVLGYGLAQKVPDLRSIDPNLNIDTTPKYLIPKGYQVTTTPGYVYADGKPRADSPYSNGTLNFCILTWREPNDPDPVRSPSRIDLAQNANSGKLSQSLFDLTKTKEHDGLMGIARDLIFDKFLAKLSADTYFIDPDKVLPEQGDIFKNSWFNDTQGLSGGAPPSYERKQEFELNTGKWHLTMDDKIKTTGFSKTTVTWDSDLQRNPKVFEKDAVRRAFVRIVSQIKIEYAYTKTELFKDTTTTTYVDVACRFGLIVTAGKGGVIDIVKEPNGTKLPEIKDGEVVFKSGTRPDGEYAAYMRSENDTSTAYEVFKAIATQGGSVYDMMESLKNLIAALDKMSEGLKVAIEAKSGETFDSIRNKIIMPAGNVFNYAGVDVDSQGNMFTHIAFALGAENVSRTGGGKPGELTGNSK